MSIVNDPRLANFFYNTAPTVYRFDTFELTHPAWSAPLLFVRNSLKPLTAIDEHGVSKTYLYYPVTLEKSGLTQTLDYTLNLSIDDVGRVEELLQTLSPADFLVKPKLIYRSYQSDDLTSPLVRVRLEVSHIPMDEISCTLQAEAPRMNSNGTGIRYLPQIFKGLRPYI